MPTLSYVPLAGKYGRVRANNSIMFLSEHEVRAQAENIDTTHFESDVDANGINVFEEGLVGTVSAEIMVRGSFDAGRNPMEAPFYLFPGMFGQLFAGLTKTYGWNMGYRCLRTPTTTKTKGAVTFEGGLKSHGLILPPAGSYT
ncbi:MAG: hypothetical protein K2X82_30125 [Gemmataceae bacterium]|nr:hypothetical protein [Gemmataceae bacterium]